MRDLSILIPSRNEMFLNNTIQDILNNIEADTEVIAVLDGQWPIEPIPDNPRVILIHFSESIGQRAATNVAARISKAKYLMKLDAHCGMDKGFDVKLMNDMQDNWTQVPIMRNLHAFDWVCECGHIRYQGPTKPCEKCGKDMRREIRWIAKTNPQSTAFRYDTTLHFQYHNERKNTAEYKDGLIIGYRLSIPSNPAFMPSGIVKFFTDFAGSHGFACRGNGLWFRQNMSSNTMRLSTINYGGSIGTEEILFIGDEAKVNGVTASSIITKMVNNWDVFSPSFWETTYNPSVENSVYECFLPETSIASISSLIDATNPVPTSRSFVNSNIINQLNSIIGGQFIYSENTKSFHNGSVALIPIKDKSLNETMSLQGSCFMCTREKYFELNLCDETWGSWGNQGTEVATKTWLSGGRVVVNKKTYYAHLFRTQGNDFGFPYPQSGRAVERARNFSRELFFNNGYDKQIYPLSWLIEKFKPIPDWHEESGKEVLDRVLKAGAVFTNFQNKSHGVLGVIPSVPGSVTNHATSMSSDGRGKEVPVPTVGLPTLPGSGTITAKDVLLIREEAEMGGITTISDTTNMVKDRDSLSLTCGDGSNKPSVNKSVDSVENLADSNLSVSPVKATIPKPATSFDINPDLPENSVNSYNRHILDNKHIMDVHDTSIAQKQKSKGILFYTNNRLNMKLAALVRKQIAKSGLPVTCVSQKPVGFGTNLVFKGDGKSGQVNMYRQILMGLEHMKEDIVFLAEADVLYHPFHFQFTPAESNKFYYNGNYWVLRLKDGFAVHYNAQWLSGLVSYREPLLVHMRERVEMIDREGYSTNMGHEPMTHKRIAWKTWYDYEVFNPGVANIDIVHSGNMTLKKWKLDDFRTKPKFWEESTNYTVPGWNLVEELKRIDKSA